MPFTYKVEIEGVDVTNAVIDGFTVQNGRSNLLEPLGQCSASFSVFRKAFYDIFATASRDPKEAGLGAYVIIDGANNTEAYFSGHVTDMSSDADTISFSLVEKNIFKLTAAPAVTTSTSTSSTDAYLTVLTTAPIPGSDVIVTSVPVDNGASVANTLQLTAKTITNRAQEIRDVIGSNETAFGWFVPGTGLKIRDRLVSPTTADATLTDLKVVKNYSLQRSIGDILNDATVTYQDSPTTTDEVRSFNVGSIENIGARNQSRTTLVNTEANANRVGKAILAAGAPYGWPIVKCQTNSVVMAYTSADMLSKFQPNNVLDCSAVTAEGFDTYMYIEQVTWRLSRDIIEADLLLSSSQYSTLPQLWQDVPGLNKVVNGQFTSNITGWESNSASYPVAHVAQGRTPGALEVTHNVTTAMGTSNGARIDNTSTYRIAVVPGQALFATAYVRNTVGTRTIQMFIRHYANATTTTIIQTDNGTTTSSTDWTRLTCSSTVPATTTHADIIVRTTNTGSIGDKFQVDDVTLAINGVTWNGATNYTPQPTWDDLLYVRL